MDKEQALSICEEISNAGIGEAAAIAPQYTPDHNGYSIHMWPTALYHEDFQTLMSICQRENLELTYDEVHYEGGEFWLLPTREDPEPEPEPKEHIKRPPFPLPTLKELPTYFGRGA